MVGQMFFIVVNVVVDPDNSGSGYILRLRMMGIGNRKMHILQMHLYCLKVFSRVLSYSQLEHSKDDTRSGTMFHQVNFEQNKELEINRFRELAIVA